MAVADHTPTIELLYFAGCPHVASTRALLQRCLAQLGLDLVITERDGDYPSPTLLVNGRDVMGEVQTSGRACRRDLPTEAHVLAALEAATRGDAWSAD